MKITVELVYAYKRNIIPVYEAYTYIKDNTNYSIDQYNNRFTICVVGLKNIFDSLHTTSNKAPKKLWLEVSDVPLGKDSIKLRYHKSLLNWVHPYKGIAASLTWKQKWFLQEYFPVLPHRSSRILYFKLWEPA